MMLENWVPYKLYFENGEPYCEWLFTGDAGFTEPFFDDTIRRCKREFHFARRFKSISAYKIMDDWSSSIEAIPPTAIIFHVSRCGSTTFSQLLAMNAENLVLSEVPFLDETLRSSLSFNTGLSFYAAKRSSNQNRLFIKTDSWHIFFYDELRNLFPTTPFILLYRLPEEVIRSHQKRRGMQSVPGLIEPALFGFDRSEIINLGLDEYMTKVLEKYFEAFISVSQSDPYSTLINYNEGMVATMEKIATLCAFDISGQEKALMVERSRYHGKYPDQVFSESNAEKDVPEFLNKAMALYNQLESIRLNLAAKK